MIKTITATAAALAVAVGGLATVTAAPAHALTDRDCGDFASQRAAQIFFLKHGGPRSDPHGLDGDDDGVVCVSNPAPYYYKKTLPGGGSGGGGGSDHSSPRRTTGAAIVVRVVDGDTVKVRIAGRQRSVRMIGIDTPEVYFGVECGGPAASRSLKKRLPKGTRVRLVADSTQDNKDRYGRLLRYVIKSGHDMNRLQVRSGHAKVYVYDGVPFKRTASYRHAQRVAKQHDLGIWGHC
jgi:endonuclease YncB( thermonuclease family)